MALMRFSSYGAAFAAVVALSSITQAQVTSGALSGSVRDATGAPVANATVTVTFTPTAQKIITRTHDDGRYFVANLRAGSPYEVAVTSIGMRPAFIRDLAVALGATTRADVVLEKSVVQLAALEVTASEILAEQKAGTSTQVGAQQLQRLPTLARSLQDMTRLTPSGNGVSFAGSNYRYNNLTIDGAASNDAFGFSASSGNSTATTPTGTPGGLARTQPISLDAVEQVTVSIAPYDVKIGNFTGGSINAVTRAGTNTTSGSIFSFGRAPAMVGPGVSGTLPSDFKDFQLGGRVGGALVKGKMFYFLNAEVARRTDPVLFAAGSGGAQLTQAIAQQVSDSLKSYANRAGVSNFDPGTIGNYSNVANSEKFLARFDWLFGSSTLTLRDNYVNAVAGNLERGQSLNKLATQDFDHYSRTNSTVGELKSRFSDNLSNSLIVGYSTVRDHRTPYGATIAPQIEIQDIQYGQINAGNDRESTVYKQHTSTLELTDNLTWSAGRHTVTFGTHNELYNVQYTFLNAYNGRWQYPNLAAFLKSQPNRIRATFSPGDNSLSAVSNNPGADFKVSSPSVYAQDDIQFTNNFKLSLGLRMDITNVDQASQASGFTNFTAADGSKPYAKYTNNYGTSVLIAPRVGFKWNAKDNDALTVRGGVGFFQGRMPYAWYAYPYLNNGSQFANVDYRPTYTAAFTSVPLIIDPTKQSAINSQYNQGSVYEINLIDNKFVQPQMARGNLAFDFRLPSETKLTLEGTYTKTVKDILYTNQGIPVSSGNLGGADSRPIYAATRLAATTGATNPYSAVYVLGNTNQGFRYSATASVEKAFTRDFNLTAAYTYGQSKDVANGQRNSPQSNVEYNQLVRANDYQLTYSNFDVRHRIVGTAGWKHNWNSTFGTSASMVYTGSSGSPYSYVYSGDVNGDGSSNNDLIYVPRSQSEINLIPSARPTGQDDTRTSADIWQQLDAFISRDPYLSARRGQYAERNGARTPWNHNLDVRIAQDIRLAGEKNPRAIQITFDVINFTNLLSSNWGKYYFVPNLNNQNVYPLAYRSGRAVGQTPNFSFDPLATTPYQYDDFQSRWQMQLGMRFTF